MSAKGEKKKPNHPTLGKSCGVIQLNVSDLILRTVWRDKSFIGVQHWFQSQRLRLRRIKQKCQPRFTQNSQEGTCWAFMLFHFLTTPHFRAFGFSLFLPRTVRCQVMQAGHVPHHKACSGLDESLNYLMATVGALRRCHLPSRGETGWLTGWYAHSRGTNQSHSRCLFNKITGMAWPSWKAHLQTPSC